MAVCTRLDGVALAIELAAARIPAMNPSELARRLDRRFRLLSGGGRVAIERHQTLRAAIDWSYDLLTEPEQRLLARLSVFSGGCTLEAAEAVCAGDPIDGDDVFELLASLVARSLVVADDRSRDPLPAVGDDPPVRRGTPRRGRRDRHVAAPPRELLHGVRRRRAESHLRAGTGRVGSTPGTRARQPARGDGLRARHPRRSTSPSGSSASSPVRASGRRRGGLRPGRLCSRYRAPPSIPAPRSR